MDPRTGFEAGLAFGRRLALRGELPRRGGAPNPLEEFFDRHDTGPGLWKWRHYFDVYHRHLHGFVGREVHVVEIGVYSGGSLGMWREYFGAGCRVYGVDIDPACRAYEGGPVRIFIGDQADPAFWRSFVEEVPQVDVAIDDGGHEPHQQIATLEALLPHIRPGGIYLCEDVHGRRNEFHDYVDGLARNLHSMGDGSSGDVVRPTGFQRMVESVHLYPFVVVIEKRATALDELSAPRHGTEWRPPPPEA